MRRKPFVLTLTGLALQAACAKEGPPPLPGNPPLQTPVTTGNPPIEPSVSSLPTWDSVASGHPEGATNPPMPVLAVTPDGRCFKEWRDPRMMTPELRADGGRILTSAAETTGTEVQCPDTAGPLLEKARGG